MHQDARPRSHAWHQPRSAAQVLSLVLFLYIAAVHLGITLPTLRDLSLGTSPEFSEDAVCLFRLSRWCLPLFFAVVVLHFLISFKDPGHGASLLDEAVNKDTVPVCAHCNGVLHPEAGSSEFVWNCTVCGATAGEASSDLVGTWVYGLHGANELEISEHVSGYYQISEASTGYDETLRPMSTLTEGDDMESWYVADYPSSSLIRMRMIGPHVLRIEHSTTHNGDWEFCVIARRRHGGCLIGDWTLPVWDRDTGVGIKICGNEPPDYWQQFSVDQPVQASCAVSDVLSSPYIREYRGANDDRYVIGAQSVLNVGEHAGGMLVAHGESTYVASLRKDDGESCGSVRLTIETDHLIYQYRPRHYDENDWGETFVALRGSVRGGVACCSRCGVASSPPATSSPYVLGHCNRCNKCVPGFDHHCIYLNQCVGRQNFKEWLALVVSVFIAISIASISAGFVLRRAIMVSPDPWMLRVVRRLRLQPITFPSLLVAFVGGVVADIFLLQLLLFHVWLSFKKETTAASIFQTTSMDSWSRRRVKHLIRSMQGVSRRSTKLTLPSHRGGTIDSKSLTEDDFMSDWGGADDLGSLSPGKCLSPLSIRSNGKLPVTPMRAPGTPIGIATPMSAGLRGPVYETPRSGSPASWCSLERVVVTAALVGVSVGDADDDLVSPTLKKPFSNAGCKTERSLTEPLLLDYDGITSKDGLSVHTASHAHSNRTVLHTDGCPPRVGTSLTRQLDFLE